MQPVANRNLERGKKGNAKMKHIIPKAEHEIIACIVSMTEEIQNLKEQMQSYKNTIDSLQKNIYEIQYCIHSTQKIAKVMAWIIGAAATVIPIIMTIMGLNNV